MKEAGEDSSSKLRRPSRSLGVSAPEGRDVHEVFVRVKSMPSILGKLSNLMGEKSVDILSVYGQVSDDKETANLVFYVEMADARTSIGELVTTLRGKEFVLDARSWPKSRMYFEEAMFPLTSGGHYRVFTVGAASWVSLIRALLGKFGSGGKAILHEEGVAVGEEMVGRIGNRFAKPEEDVMLENLKGLFSASGLGVLQIERAEPQPHSGAVAFKATLTSPVVAESNKPLVDDFVVGVVRGAFSKISSKKFWVKDAVYRDGKIEFQLIEG